MNLIKTGVLNGISVIIKIIVMLGINKIIALYAGPSGYAAIGQLQNFVQIVNVFASGGISSAVIVYTAKFDGQTKQFELWSAAFLWTSSISIICMILVIFFREDLAVFFLQDKIYADIFTIYGFAILPYTVNLLIISIINGKKEIYSYVLANVLSSFLAIALTYSLTYFYDFYGVLASLVLYQSIPIITTLYICKSKKWFKFDYFRKKIHVEHIKSILKYSLMGLSSAILGPLTYILVRIHVSDNFGTSDAGHWEAIWRLSSAYLLMITTMLSYYFIPKFSELTEKKDILNELLNAYKVIIPIYIIASVIIFSIRHEIISLLFSPKFNESANLIIWQLIGDFFKMCAMLISFLVLSQGLTKAYIVSELVFSFSFYSLSLMFSLSFGTIGIGLAHVTSYILFFLYFLMVFRINFK